MTTLASRTSRVRRTRRSSFAPLAAPFAATLLLCSPPAAHAQEVAKLEAAQDPRWEAIRRVFGQEGALREDEVPAALAEMHRQDVRVMAVHNHLIGETPRIIYVHGMRVKSTELLETAGPPFLTDDPEPVEYQHHEFYIASQQTRTAEGTAGTLPQLEYNYGAAPDLQLHIIVPYAFSSLADGRGQSGLGDIELGAKYRFLQETDSRPMVGIFPIVLTHTGIADKGLGNGATQVFLPVWLQKKWGDWQSYGGGGYWINHVTGAKNHWFFGWQVQDDISEHLTLGGEIFHSTEQAPGEGSSTGFNLGEIYSFDKQNHLLFSAGKGLTNISMTNEFSSYVGFQWTW
jgi:Domain of Unknown Function (DUF1259)